MDRPPRRSLKTGETAPLLIYEADRYPQVVRWTLASETTGGKDEVPSQGTAPISPLFSRAQFLVGFGAGQQDSSGYSLAREGWTRHQVNGPVPLTGADGVVRSTSNHRCLNEPPRLRPLRRLRRFFLMGAATPPLPERGILYYVRAACFVSAGPAEFFLKQADFLLHGLFRRRRSVLNWWLGWTCLLLLALLRPWQLTRGWGALGCSGLPSPVLTCRGR